MSDLIQLNRLCDLHDGEKIIFCKTDYLTKEFEDIKSLDNKVVLVSGNSDYGITEEVAARLPLNVTRWFCQNNLTTDSRLTALPLGIENSREASRPGHGVGWQHAIEKERLLSYFYEEDDVVEAENLVYANFNISTNLSWRQRVKDACHQSDLVTLEEERLSYLAFLSRILHHTAVACPLGNAPQGGSDNHRIYETLYLNRIPIVFRENQGRLYEGVYKHLPIVCLDDLEELFDKEHLLLKINEVKLKSREYISHDYWRQRILEASGE